MKELLWNLLLALVWMFLTGDVSGRGLLVGFVFGFLVLMVAGAGTIPGPYARRMGRGAAFAFFYIGELVLSSLRVAYDVLTPRQMSRPAIIAVHLEEGHTDASATVLANLITMTPGTMSLDVSPDRRVLYIHAMFAGDRTGLRRGVKQDFERRVLELARPARLAGKGPRAGRTDASGEGLP